MKLSNNIYAVKFNEHQFSYAHNPSVCLDFKKHFILMNIGETDITKYYNTLRGIFNREYSFWNEMNDKLQIQQLY